MLSVRALLFQGMVGDAGMIAVLTVVLSIAFGGLCGFFARRQRDDEENPVLELQCGVCGMGATFDLDTRVYAQMLAKEWSETHGEIVHGVAGGRTEN